MPNSLKNGPYQIKKKIKFVSVLYQCRNLIVHNIVHCPDNNKEMQIQFTNNMAVMIFCFP